LKNLRRKRKSRKKPIPINKTQSSFKATLIFEADFIPAVRLISDGRMKRTTKK
jgi:hypothetical protein